MNKTEKRKQCSECPWKGRSSHDRKMTERLLSLVEAGKKENSEHRCHMISTDLWGEVSQENVCIGSQCHNDD